MLPLDDYSRLNIVQVSLEPSSYTDEKFALYKVYQKEIHKEEEEKTTSGFRRFLIQNPLHVGCLLHYQIIFILTLFVARRHTIFIRPRKPPASTVRRIPPAVSTRW